MTSWWSNASKAEKLKQIDAGISLGMSAKQIALALGTTTECIHQYGWKNDRSFPTPMSVIRSKAIKASKANSSIRMSRMNGHEETEHDLAFSIFGTRQTRPFSFEEAFA